MADPATPATPAAPATTVTPPATTTNTPPAEPHPSEVPSVIGGDENAPPADETPEQKAARETAEKEAEDKANAEITYTDFKLPEGVTIEAPILEAATAQFKKDGLSQEQAQGYIDMATGLLQEQAKRFGAEMEAPYKLWGDTQREWQAQIKADPVMGGSPENLAKTRQLADKAIAMTGFGPALKAALNVSGAGNHPDIVRAFRYFGERISEGKFVPAAGGNAEQPGDLASALYRDKPDPFKR